MIDLDELERDAARATVHSVNLLGPEGYDALVRELRAARKCVEFLRKYKTYQTVVFVPCAELDAIVNEYDEAVRG